GVAGGEAPIGRDLVELVVVDNLEDHVEEVEAVLAGVALDLPPPPLEVGREIGHAPSEPLAQELLDRVVDLVAVADVAGDDLLLPGEGLLEVRLEAAASVGRPHLAEPEEVQL